MLGNKMLTPQMRYHLYNNASLLTQQEHLELRKIAKQACPDAVNESSMTGEVSIDIDALDFPAFLRLDIYVRKQVAARAI